MLVRAAAGLAVRGVVGAEQEDGRPSRGCSPPCGASASAVPAGSRLLRATTPLRTRGSRRRPRPTKQDEQQEGEQEPAPPATPSGALRIRAAARRRRLLGPACRRGRREPAPCPSCVLPGRRGTAFPRGGHPAEYGTGLRWTARAGKRSAWTSAERRSWPAWSRARASSAPPRAADADRFAGGAARCDRGCGQRAARRQTSPRSASASRRRSTTKRAASSSRSTSRSPTSRFRDRMQERFKLPIGLDNDANCAAIGEWRIGAGARRDRRGHAHARHRRRRRCDRERRSPSAAAAGPAWSSATWS